ncbi:MAG: PDZ domain-containing protein [Chlamydiia bacterium]|nr:PDZ domain-containing protein [Chlamydiia bacterium]
MNTAIYTRSGGYMGIGLAIPSRIVQTVVEQIRDFGTVKRAYLGIVLQPLDKELADAMGAEKQEGILVSEVMKESPAFKAGLLQGDVILQLNQKAVKNVAKFRNEISLMKPGSAVQLRILRNNKPMTLDITLGSQSEGEEISAEVLQKLGIEVDNLSAELAAKFGIPATESDCVVITRVKPGSPAAMAGLRPSFLITGVALDWNNQKRVTNLSALQEALKDLSSNQKHIILIVKHQNFQRYYTIKL